MMETAHKSVLNEIEKSRVKSVRSSNTAEQNKAPTGLRARTYLGGYKTQNQVHAKSSNKQPSDLSDGERDLATINSRSRSMRASNTEDQSEVEKILNEGLLYKTSRGKITSDLTRGQHEHRQHRRFQLTEHSLEYSQLLQRVSHALTDTYI